MIQRVKPIITTKGASLILLKLYISLLKISGLFDVPPDIRKKPIIIKITDINSSLYLFLLNRKFFFMLSQNF